MKKYTIVQTEPDYDVYYQDSLMEITSDPESPFFIEGTDRQEGVNEKWLYTLMDHMKRGVNEYNSQDVYDPERGNTLEDMVTDYFPDGNDKQIKKLMEVAAELSENNCAWKDEIIARYLSAFYKTEYTYKKMRGYVQDECVVIYYPAFVNDRTLNYIEAIYFEKYNEFHCEERERSAIVTHDELWKYGKKAVADAFGLDQEEVDLQNYYI